MVPAPMQGLAEEQPTRVAELKSENRRLRRENKWHRLEAEKWRARAEELEAQLAAALLRSKKGRRAATDRPTKPAPKAETPLDWNVFYMLGSGMKELKDKADLTAYWDNLSVDWSGTYMPKSIVPRAKFWDRPLNLDWSSAGLPGIAYPGPRARVAARAREAKAPPAPADMPIDWEVFHMLGDGARLLRGPYVDPLEDTDVWSPKSALCNECLNEVEMMRYDDGEYEDELIIDWSGRWLPRRDGCCGPKRRPVGVPRGAHRRAVRGPGKLVKSATEMIMAATMAAPTVKPPSLKKDIPKIKSKGVPISKSRTTGSTLVRCPRPIMQPGGRQGCHR